MPRVPNKAKAKPKRKPVKTLAEYAARDGFVEWIKPSGVVIETNDMPETIEYCESLGWERK